VQIKTAPQTGLLNIKEDPIRETKVGGLRGSRWTLKNI